MTVNHIKRLSCILAFLFLTVVCVYAQNGRYHTVGKGETLSTIAKQYGVNEADIKKANPMASKVFYVGLKLVIPEQKTGENTGQQEIRGVSDNSLKINKTAPALSKQTAPEQNKSKEPAKNKLQIKPVDLSRVTISAGLAIGSDFSKLVGFNYGLFANVFVNGGLGAYASLSTNFPFASSADGDFIIKIGPEYKYDISDNFSIGGALCYSLTIAKYISNKALISGVSIMPYACYSYGNLEFSLSLDTYLRNGHSGLRIGPYFGVGYAF